MLKRMMVLAAVVAMALPALADDCKVCVAQKSLGEKVIKMGGKVEMLSSSTGMVQLVTMKNAADAKVAQGEVKKLMAMAAQKDLALCGHCEEVNKLVVAKKATVDMAPTQLGFVLLFTSPVEENAKLIHAAMGGATKTADACCAAPAATTVAAGQLLSKGDGQKTCLVTGEELHDKNISLAVEGTTYYFCCPGCKAKVEANPAQYVRMNTEKKAEAPAVKLLAQGDGVNTCLVTGEELHGGGMTVAVDGKEYKVCCGGCKAKVTKNPELYVAGLSAKK